MKKVTGFHGIARLTYLEMVSGKVKRVKPISDSGKALADVRSATENRIEELQISKRFDYL